jgi:hypothetical protein
MLHAIILAVAAQQAAPRVIRHLDFHFGISIRTTDTQHMSGIGSGPISGVADSTASGSNQGTISIDVVGLRPDTGLVANVTETSREITHATTIQCITWGIGTVVCEPGKQPTPEEDALLRFLGRAFINSSRIDENNHWRIATSSKQQSETDDYRITANTNGLMNIKFDRVSSATGANGYSATTDGSLTYDANLTVPRQIDESTVMRADTVGGNVSLGGYEEVYTMVNVKLVDDSMAKAP